MNENNTLSLVENEPIELSLQEFFTAFGYAENERVYFRTFHDADKSINGKKLDCETSQLNAIQPTLRKYNSQRFGIFFVVNGSGQTDNEVKKSGKCKAQFMEIDDKTMHEQISVINAFPLRPSIVVRTRKSLHCYWLIKNGDIKLFRSIQDRLISYFNSDQTIKNESRVMRVPTFDHCKSEPIRVEVIYFHPELKYTQQELISVLPEVKKKQVPTKYQHNTTVSPESVSKSEKYLESFFSRHSIACSKDMYTIQSDNEEVVAYYPQSIAFIPWHDEYTTPWRAGDTIIFIRKDGTICFDGRHNTDKQKSWSDFKRYYEPEEANTKDIKSQLIYSEVETSNGEIKRKLRYIVKNIEIIITNDIRFKGKIRYNEFSHQIDILGSLPWKNDNTVRTWTDSDDSALFSLIQLDYGFNKLEDCRRALDIVAHNQSYHPVKDKLESLEYKGDGYIKRLLPEFLGVEDSEYTYQVMRLFMLGAIERIYHAGCKFDYTLMIQGKQGIQKSSFLCALALDDSWFNDSLSDLDNKDTVQALCGSWIIELSELKSFSRTAGGMDSVKRFLTATKDKIRFAYERRIQDLPRQCVFAGTTNKSDFLQDDTGNRRFLIVEARQDHKTRDVFSNDSMQIIESAWAEAMKIHLLGNYKLVLDTQFEDIAKDMQSLYVAEDLRTEIIEDYLNTKLRDRGLTSITEVWQNALHESGTPSKYEASSICQILINLGYEKTNTPRKVNGTSTRQAYRKRQSVVPDMGAKTDSLPDELTP